MKRGMQNYWLWQIGGWGLLFIITMSMSYTFDYIKPGYFTMLIISIIWGIIITHLMRYVIKQYNVIGLPLQRQILYLLIITFSGALAYAIVDIGLEKLLNYNPERYEKYGIFEMFIMSFFNTLWILLIWSLLYFSYHYIMSTRRREIDNLRLEALVKTLELKTIKSHINPHFIFNALNSIRALVEEDPTRARTAITELSKILRSSLNADQAETVPLAQEFEIVKDYLALEQLRFEERLQITYEVDPETLQEPVPPMMLQTLVENAIKHGISKKVEGGMIHIISRYNNSQHELIVQNTGTLKQPLNGGGFGIKGTQDRLNLLYSGIAKFDIYNIEGGKVESKISFKKESKTAQHV